MHVYHVHLLATEDQALLCWRDTLLFFYALLDAQNLTSALLHVPYPLIRHAAQFLVRELCACTRTFASQCLDLDEHGRRGGGSHVAVDNVQGLPTRPSPCAC